MKEKIINLVLCPFRDESGFKISVEAAAIGLVIVLGVIATLHSPAFLSMFNLTLILDSITLYILLALGLTFVLMSGSVNLAVGGKLALSCVLFALLSRHIGLWSIPIVAAAGFVMGWAIGLVFNILKIPSFVATFGMMGVYTSLAVVISGGSPIVLSMDVTRQLRILNRMIVPGVRVQYLIAAAVFLVFLFIQKRTSFGKFVMAVGNSQEATKHIGVNVGRMKLMCFGLSGLSIALGAILLTSRLHAGDPTVGAPYLLLMVAVVIVGGTSLTGGTGGVVNTLLGALTISVLQNVLQITSVNIYYHSVIIGAVMIIAVTLSLDKKRVLVVK